MSYSLLISGKVFILKGTEDYTLSGEMKTGNKLFLHLDLLTKWTPSLYKELLQELLNIRIAAEEQGLDKIYCLVDNVPKMIKFEAGFGFFSEAVYKDTETGHEWVLMSQGVG